MDASWHVRLIQILLVANSLFWLPCGLINLLRIGVFALVGAFRPTHRDSALLFFVLALTGLSLCRLGGMIVEGESRYLSFGTTIAPGEYNQVGLAMYELPNMILAWAIYLVRPRTAASAS